MEARTAKNTKADRLIRLSIWISLFFLTGCVGIGHTSLSLTHDQLSTESRGGLGKIAVLKSAEDQRTRADRIGHAT